MSEENTTVATVADAPAAPKAKAPKAKAPKAKAPAKKAAPKAVKKAVKEKTEKKFTKDDELNTTQRIILKVLAKAKGPLTRSEIAERAAKAGAKTSLGRLYGEKANYDAVVEFKWAREQTDLEVDGRLLPRVYTITAAGRKKLEKDSGK